MTAPLPASPSDAPIEPSGFPGPGSVTWTLLGQWRMALIMPRLLVLQAAHPVVGAGLAKHSTYRTHPWRRVDHTLISLQRFVYAPPEQRHKEVERILRAHRRIKGTDERGRAYAAGQPEVRAWVLGTVFEAMSSMERLAGRPLTAADEARLYGEWRATLGAFGLEHDLLPPDLDGFWEYFERMQRDVLEDNTEVRFLMRDMYRGAATPSVLEWCPSLWALMRSSAAMLMPGAVAAQLPRTYRERLHLHVGQADLTLSRTVHRTARTAMEPLPVRSRYMPIAAAAMSGRALEKTAEVRPGGFGLPGAGLLARPLGLVRAVASAAVRGPERDSRADRLGRFFSQVLDQTGDGRIDAHDLQAMARAVCWPLELSPEQEDRVYAGFTAWWEHMRSTMDTDGDGHISKEEWIAATLRNCDADPAYVRDGVHHAVRVMFEAVDTDGSGGIDRHEYRTVFSGGRIDPGDLDRGFDELDVDKDGTISLSELLDGFTAFFMARESNVSGAQLLGRA
ncbi:EF-hand domain-containing protein [Streptomyces sp. NPDC006627]|uniref:EF-hand domain-containing protein n=1 Tax=Streptomyces sp. NPDC006627 TaxID=3154679 RepID=UPI0033A3AE58